LLIDKDGHVIHIDYGFLLGISPGSNLGFEAASFKLDAEMMQLLGGDGSELYEEFSVLAVRGFLAARNIKEPIMTAVATLADSGLPCFRHKSDNLVRLRDRFVPEMNNMQASVYFRKIIRNANQNVTTWMYDGIQKLQNNIYSSSWL